MFKPTKKEIAEALADILYDCLSSGNQEGGEEIIDIDMNKMKATVKFDIVILEKEEYIGFRGY